MFLKGGTKLQISSSEIEGCKNIENNGEEKNLKCQSVVTLNENSIETLKELISNFRRKFSNPDEKEKEKNDSTANRMKPTSDESSAEENSDSNDQKIRDNKLSTINIFDNNTTTNDPKEQINIMSEIVANLSDSLSEKQDIRYFYFSIILDKHVIIMSNNNKNQLA